MPYVTKYAIKIDNLNLFWANGGWKASPDDATKFDLLEEARNRANALQKPGLVIVTIKTGGNNPNYNW